MKSLVLNCGSSTLKYQVFEMDTNISIGQGRRLARGLIEKIGVQVTIRFVAESGEHLQESEMLTAHAEAIHQVFGWSIHSASCQIRSATG